MLPTAPTLTGRQLAGVAKAATAFKSLLAKKGPPIGPTPPADPPLGGLTGAQRPRPRRRSISGLTVTPALIAGATTCSSAGEEARTQLAPQHRRRVSLPSLDHVSEKTSRLLGDFEDDGASAASTNISGPGRGFGLPASSSPASDHHSTSIRTVVRVRPLSDGERTKGLDPTVIAAEDGRAIVVGRRGGGA